MQLAQRLYEDGQSFATAWNFGPNDHDAKSVQSIVKDVLNIWGDRADWIINSDAPTHEAQSLKLDCSKAKLQLGWKPQWTIEKTLARIVNWHRQWLAGADMYAYSMAEIYEYTHSS
jgi:CDP-glucose 4,6-dehydratase